MKGSKLKGAGFYQELPHGSASGPLLRDLVSDQPQENEARIVEYLRNGILLVGCPGVVGDVLDSSAGMVASPHILTDTVWAWPGDLAYYVEKYHIALPREFVAHMQASNWSIPDATGVDLAARLPSLEREM
jgi:hypothetical protein